MFATYLTIGLCVWFVLVVCALAFVRGANAKPDPDEFRRIRSLSVRGER